jgi:serine/threonine protein kinase
MTYPLISEYVEAVRNAEDNFDKLRNLRLVTDGNGNPVMTSGNFAVVFKMRDEKNDKLYAVKCFHKDQPNRAENYRMIAEELEFVSSSFLTKFQYLDNELFVDSANADGEEFPVLLMDWVEGTNLDQYIRQHLHDSYQLHLLAYQFSRLALWLMPQPFAHGDLKPDNIMVREDGTLVLIDYDGMFVPAMKGQKAREMGSPDFRHPARTEETFNEHIDDFSLASILLSLRVLSEEPALLEKYGAADRLLFSEKDYKNIHDCQLLKDIFPSECPEVNTLVGLFIIALTQSDLSNISFRLLSLERPKEPEIEIISTYVTEEDEKDAWTDEFGVKYSKDGKKLIDCTDDNLTSYTIRQGTRIICDGAFFFVRSLQSVTIPDSVTSIGDSVFWFCSSLQSVIIPDSVTSIGDNAFMNCSSLQSVTIPDFVTSIGDSAFSECKSLQSVIIPDSVTIIKGNPFPACPAKVINHSNHFTIFEGNLYTSDRRKLISYLSKGEHFIISDSVTSIGDGAFEDCWSLQSVTIPDSVTSIGESAFDGCKALQSVTIPDSVTSIGESAFDGCKALQSVTIPDSVTSIGDSAFSCSSLQSVAIPDSVTSIGDNAFWGCSSLQSVSIPDSVTSIGDSAFYRCLSLQSVTIPDSVTSIGNGAFNDCSSLQSVTIPDSVTSIGDDAFRGCESLQSVTIPDSVTSIGDDAFRGCESLQSVTIPGSVTSIGDDAFRGCESLQSVTIPDSVTSIAYRVFEDCSSLQSIIISHKTYDRLKDKLEYYSSMIKFTD